MSVRCLFCAITVQRGITMNEHWGSSELECKVKELLLTNDSSLRVVEDESRDGRLLVDFND